MLILVVNQRQEDSGPVQEANSAFLRDLRTRAKSWLPVEGSALSLAQLDDACAEVALIDATRAPLALGPKEGVGRARKMGADLALALFEAGKLRSPWLGSSDADAALPVDYFDVLATVDVDGTALLFPYTHAGTGAVGEAMKWVEAGFRYHVLGLASAGSPYAYHALGSAMAVFLPAYAKARGFPNRQAGEDFYLLSKLARIAPLVRLESPRIRLHSRLSDRVPFGTGPALERALTRGGMPLAYHPRSFAALRVALGQLEKRLCEPLVPFREPLSLSRSEDHPEAHFAARWAQGKFSLWEAGFRECPGVRHRLGRLYERFDALGTLRFVRSVSETFHGDVPLNTAIERSGLVGRVPGRAADVDWVLDRLKDMEEGLPSLVVATGHDARPLEERVLQAMGSLRYFTFD